MEKIKYHKPVVEKENIYDVEAGGITLFSRCWCTPPDGWGGQQSSLPVKQANTN